MMDGHHFWKQNAIYHSKYPECVNWKCTVIANKTANTNIMDLKTAFIHSVNSNGSKTTRIIKNDITQHHIDSYVIVYGKITFTYVRWRVNFPLTWPWPSQPAVGQLDKQTHNSGILRIFSGRCNIYISRLCYYVSVWHISTSTEWLAKRPDHSSAPMSTDPENLMGEDRSSTYWDTRSLLKTTKTAAELYSPLYMQAGKLPQNRFITSTKMHMKQNKKGDWRIDIRLPRSVRRSFVCWNIYNTDVQTHTLNAARRR